MKDEKHMFDLSRDILSFLILRISYAEQSKPELRNADKIPLTKIYVDSLSHDFLCNMIKIDSYRRPKTVYQHINQLPCLHNCRYTGQKGSLWLMSIYFNILSA